MEAKNNPLDAVRTMMIDTFEKSRTATQSYFDLFETTMRSFPNAKDDQVGAFKAYVERQVAANHALVDKLLRARDFQEPNCLPESATCRRWRKPFRGHHRLVATCGSRAKG